MHLKIYLGAKALKLILPTLFAHSIILRHKDSAHTHFDIVDLLRVMMVYFKYAISNMKMQLMCYKYWKLHPPYPSSLNVYSYFCHNCGHNLMKLYCKLRFVFITALNTLEHTHTITNIYWWTPSGSCRWYVYMYGHGYRYNVWLCLWLE